MIAKRLPRLAKTSLACLALAGLAVSASADDLYWEHDPADHPGNWFDTANWSTLALPSSADSAYIDNGGTADISSGNATAAYLYAGYSQQGTVKHSAGTNALRGETLVIGDETYYLGGELHLGHLSGSDGIYELSGTGLLSALTEYVGHAGTGTFRQSDGTNDVVNWLCIGAWVTGSGSYELSGTAELSADSEQVGLLGRGTFTQSGGTNTVATALIVGGALGPTSTYTLTDGHLSALNEYIGCEGIATFTHSGGTNTVGEELVLGYKGGSSGTYELAGTDSHLSVQNEYVGYEDRGTFLQTAGSHTVAGALYIGHEANSNGACEIFGGSLDVADLVVGLNGEGELTVSSGGTVEVGDTLKVVWGGGTVNLQSGGSIVAGTFDNSGTGAFNFTGGTLAVTTFLGDLVCAGGTIAPGASLGTTTVSGGLTMDSGTIRIEIGGSGSPSGAAADSVDVTGTLTLGDDTDLEFVFGAADPFEAGTYTLASYGTLVGTFSSVTSLGAYSTGVDYGANAITIELLAGLLAGDANMDRTTNALDYMVVATGYGVGSTWTDGDVNDDGAVNALDYMVLATNYGSHVPEPTTLLLMGVGLGLAIARKHNGRRG